MKIFITWLLFAFGISAIPAQESINATGGDASGVGGSIAYSVGQIFYTTANSVPCSISQGVQQPYEFYTLGTDEINDISISYLAYPNPTNSSINLFIDNQKLELLSFQILDINGKHLYSQKIISNTTSIDMKNYASAIYFLKVIANNEEIKTIKIIKTYNR